MAIGTSVKSTQGLKLAIYHEATMGDSGLNSGAVRYQLPILSPPTIQDLTGVLESTPSIIGQYNHAQNHSVHNRASQMYEIGFQILGSPAVLDLMCLYLINDGDGTNALQGGYSPPAMLNGADTDYSVCIDIAGGGYETASASVKKDIRYVGCVAKSMTLNHAIDNESGLPVIDMVFVTGYAPQYTDDLTDGDYTPVKLTGDGATPFTNWNSANTYIDSNGAGYEIHPYSYSVSISREIERVGFGDYTNYEPDGYAMMGVWEVEMSIDYKRDENFDNFLAKLSSGAEITARIGDASANPFKIECVGLVSDHSTDTGSAELRNTITIKGMVTNNTSADLIVLSM